MDIARLLDTYARVLTLAADPPPSLRLPARRLASSLRALHLALRPRVGAEYWAEREIRRSVDALERGLARALAVMPRDDGERDERDGRDGRDGRADYRERLQQFRDSLASTRSAPVVAVLVLAFLLLAQFLLDGLPSFIVEHVDSARLKEGLAEIGPSPSVTSAKQFADAVVHSTRLELLIFVTALSWSAYAVLRLPAGGYRLAMFALGRDAGLRVLRGDSELARAQRALGMREQQTRAFAALGLAPAPSFPVDVGVKAAFWAPVLLYAAGGIRWSLQSPMHSASDLPGALVLVAIVLARYTFLARAGHQRGNDMWWLWIGVAIIVAVGLGAQLEPAAR